MSRHIVVAAVLLSAGGCDGDPIEPSLRPETIEVSPETGRMVMFGDVLRLTATVRDQNGDTMSSAAVQWSTEDSLVATVTRDGIVSARGSGVVRVQATAGAVSDAATITVDLFQRDALMKLYGSLNGDDWIRNGGWGTRTMLGTWHGVETDEDGNVARLELTRNNLNGEIPSEVKFLSYLRGLNLSFNDSLSGNIPPEIGELENLTELSLHHNSLTGPIPSGIANLTNLDTLDIHHNQLTGPLPEWLGDLSNLSYLSVWGNELTGPLPASLGNLTDLYRLWVNINDLSGPLPRTLTGLTLGLFYWRNTDLCSPQDDEFQNWLETVPDMFGGPPCDQ